MSLNALPAHAERTTAARVRKNAAAWGPLRPMSSAMLKTAIGRAGKPRKRKEGAHPATGSENAPAGAEPKRARRISARNGTCPPAKRVPGTRIVVDGFRFACAELSDAYILTHFHSDHYAGLSKTFSCGRILCTPTTAALVRQAIGVDERFLVPAAVGATIAFADCAVSVIDANHCPGAAMFLIRAPSGAMTLHCGVQYRPRPPARPGSPPAPHPSRRLPLPPGHARGRKPETIRSRRARA